MKSFSFVDSVTKFGKVLTFEDLETAYGRAGTSFNGQLQQNFVVLNERDQQRLQSVSGTAGGGGATSRGGMGPGTSGFRGFRGGPRGGARGGSGGHTYDPSRGTKRPGSNLESSFSKK
jgi:hypothetical protein